MPKRYNTRTFRNTMGKVSKMLAEDDSILYVVVENRVKPEFSMVVLNIKWFTALINSVEDNGISEEAETLYKVLLDIKQKSSNSFRERALSNSNILK